MALNQGSGAANRYVANRFRLTGVFKARVAGNRMCLCSVVCVSAGAWGNRREVAAVGGACERLRTREEVC